MKKIFLFIALLTTISFSQSAEFILLMNDEGYKNAETRIYLASLTTPISPTYAATLDSFITMVKDSLAITSLSSKFDVMYDLGGETSEQSLKNMVKRSHDATAVNSPTWTQWQGFTSANTKYLNTNFNAATQGVSFTQNSATYGLYSRTDNNTTPSVDIGVDGWSDMDIRTNNLFVIRVNTATLKSFANTSSLGFFISSRTANNLTRAYKNGVKLDSSTAASATLRNGSIYIGALHQLTDDTAVYFSLRQYSFAFISSGLTATEVSKLTNCVEWLMDRKGTGVIP